MTVTSTTKLGLSQAEKGDLVGNWIGTWNQDHQRIEERLATSYAGDPNGNVAGYWVGQRLWDSANNVEYVCTTPAVAADAVWQLLTSLLSSGIAAAGLKVSSNDTTPGTLEAKLLVSSSLVLSTQNDGANETRTLDLASGIKSVHLSNRTIQAFSADGSSPGTTLSFPAQVRFDLSDGTAMALAAMTKRVNANWTAGTGNGALDTGSVANSSTYYVYVIHNPTTLATDVLFSLSATAPTMPSGYTKSRRVGSFTTDGTATINGHLIDWAEAGTGSAAKAVFAVVADNTNTASEIRLRVGSEANTVSNAFTFDSSGNFTAAGNVTAYSDENLKENVETIEGALDLVKNLRGVRFDWITSGKPAIGVIAQEVQPYLPEVVLETEQGMLSVAYGNLVAVLINAVNELAAQVEDLKK